MMIVHVDPSAKAHTRRACDRCHRLKLRCSRERDETCHRCLRARTECVSSCHSKSRRVQQSGVASPEDTAGVVGGPTRQPGSPETPVAKPPLNSHPPVHDKEASTEESGYGNDTSITGKLTLWMKKASDLCIPLMEQLTLLSGVDEINGSGEGELPQHTTLLDIDKTICLSQSFIDILGGICSGLPPLEYTSHNGGHDNFHTANFCLDPASELLIFSNYLRLVEIYDTILRRIRDALHRNQSNPAAQYAFEFPKLTIGTASIQTGSGTSHLFFINLLEVMFGQIRNLINKLASPKITPGYRGDFNNFGGVSLVIVPDLALQAIRIRENAVLHLLDSIKQAPGFLGS